MPLPLPNLDTRRWNDLVDDALAQIPRYAPSWTDYNAHDPGVTLVELFAWLAEMDVYRTNRVPPRHVLKFLELMGYPPKPPAPARAPLTFTGTGLLPAGSQFATSGGIAFRTLRDLTIGPVEFAALQVDAGNGIVKDRTSQLMAAANVEILGHQPMAGSSAYFGFTQLPAGAPLSVYFWLAEAGGGTASLQWETFTGGADPWTATAVIRDHTRTLTESGELELSIPAGLIQTALGEVTAPLFYLRCRVVSASYDSTPVAVRVAANTIVAGQSVPYAPIYTIAAGAAVTGPAPAPGDSISFQLTVNSSGVVESIDFLPAGAGGAPAVRVLSYQAPAGANPGSIGMEIARILDSLLLPGAPIEQSSLHVITNQGSTWQQWMRRADFDSSTRSDFHFTVDPTSGQLAFGDGERGRALPEDASVFAAYHVTLAAQGNVAPRQVTTSPLPGMAVTNQGAGFGGTDQEDLESATGRAAAVLYCHDPLSPHPPTNAVNLRDYEHIALYVPHTRVARAKAYANLDGRYPCLTAPGSVTVVIIPDMEILQPMPSPHLLATVAHYLCLRRTVCTQVHVIGPTYVAVSVSARVEITADSSAAAVLTAIMASLNAFLDPLHGGPDGTGWPFGRDVYRTEIMQLIAAVDGVNYVSALTLTGNGGTPSCGNLSICAGALVSPGTHRIQIAMEAS